MPISTLYTMKVYFAKRFKTLLDEKNMHKAVK
jgi:hypothetical protein